MLTIIFGGNMKKLELSERQAETIYTYSMDNKTANSLSSFFSVFADETRLKIISLLSIYPMCVGDISHFLRINQTTISHQLKFLKLGGIVDSWKEGKLVYYKLIDKYVNVVLEQGVDRHNEICAS